MQVPHRLDEGGPQGPDHIPLVHGKSWCAGGLWIDTTEAPLNDNDAKRFANTSTVWIDREVLSRWPVPGETAREPHRKNPRPHQVAAVHEIMTRGTNGRVTMACGTGKTLVGVLVGENTGRTEQPIVVCAPSIALVEQTADAWEDELGRAVQVIRVCSTQDAGARRAETNDYRAASRATTDPAEIARQAELARQKNRRPVIFTTYHSLFRIAKAQRLSDRPALPEAALTICDEAHRTAGRAAPKNETERAFRSSTKRPKRGA